MPSLILVIRAAELKICVNCAVRTEFTFISIIAELSPLPLFKLGLLLSFDFLANGNLFG
jgi:hypothetical protein